MKRVDRSNRRWLQWGAYAALAVLIVAAVASLMPSDYDLVRPLEPQQIGEHLNGGSPTGDVMLLAVDSHRAKWSEVVASKLFGRGTLVRRTKEAAGADVNEAGNLSGKQLLADSHSFAALAVARALDIEGVESSGRGIRVMDEGTNPQSELRSGDVIVELNGRPMNTLPERVLMRRGPNEVTLEDGRTVTVPGDPNAALFGVAVVETDHPTVNVPGLTWDLSEAPDVAGSSAGLALALAMADRIEDGGLLDGRTVAATGEVGSDGTVYPVGGMREKAIAARDADIDILFVPRDNGRTARRYAGDTTVIEVTSVADALEALSDN
jgi:PDZ domain-containing protein